MGIKIEVPYQAFIGGSWRATRETFPVYNPANGAVIAYVAHCGIEEAQLATEQAVESFQHWKCTSAFERAALLRRWHDLIIEHETELAQMVTAEMGRPIRESRTEVRYAASFVLWYAEEAIRVTGEILPGQFDYKRLLVRKQPVGPVFAITPWNFPLSMITRKVAPALAAGCTVVVKPAPQTPVCALLLGKLWEQAGGPGATFQIIPTDDAEAVSTVFFQDARIRKLSFTGSTEVGKLLATQAVSTLKRVSLELGGHAPLIVFDDADLASAVQGTIACKFRNAGQTCVCANRIYVHDRIADDFIDQFTKAVHVLRVGDPVQEETDIGPLVDQQGLDKVSSHVRDAIEKGAEVVTGGKIREGLYYEPTVLCNLQPGMRILEEETFGPVAPIVTFQDDEEVIKLANNTPYGLAAYFWTKNLERVFKVSEALDYGIVSVNDGIFSAVQAPFGGVKSSGIGREGGHWGIDEYLDIKYISITLS